MSEYVDDEGRREPRVGRTASNQPISTGNEALMPLRARAAAANKRRHHTPRARRMSLSLTRVDAWSRSRSLSCSVCRGHHSDQAAAPLWLVLNMAGVFDRITQIVSSTGLDSSGFNLADVLSLSTVLSTVTILAIIGVVLFTLLATIFALLYNVVSSLVGGVHVTLGDD